MNLIEQFLAESIDHHTATVDHINKAAKHGADVRDYHDHKHKQTGFHPVSKDHMDKIHDHLLTHGYAHTAKKDDIHVYKKGKTTVTAYPNDKDIDVKTKKSVNESHEVVDGSKSDVDHHKDASEHAEKHSSKPVHHYSGPTPNNEKLSFTMMHKDNASNLHKSLTDSGYAHSTSHKSKAEVYRKGHTAVSVHHSEPGNAYSDHKHIIIRTGSNVNK